MDDIVLTAVRDLRPLHSRETSGDRPELRRLTDRELLQACHTPANGDRLRVNARTERLIDGNGRAYELQRRASDGASTIQADTLVPCERYRPDLSMFPDIP
ncbi:MAG: hypothetical protein AAF561_13265 [Planctomycetota bacterium]